MGEFFVTVAQFIFSVIMSPIQLFVEIATNCGFLVAGITLLILIITAVILINLYKEKKNGI